MVKMTSLTIKEAMDNIVSEKYKIPAFQRSFVWSLVKIEKMWDSILMGYPISTFLFWHVDENNCSEKTHFVNFRNDVTFRGKEKPLDDRNDIRNNNFSSTMSYVDFSKTDTAILDGQQRLTSLFLSLCGDVKVRSGNRTTNVVTSKIYIELDENKTETDQELDETGNKNLVISSMKYDISYTDKLMKDSELRTKFEIRNIMNPEFENRDTRFGEIEKWVSKVSENSQEYARNILNALCKSVYEDRLINALEVLETSTDDALEMFIRFNSEGVKLKKSEITMSIFTSYWDNASEKFSSVLTGPYNGFSTEFIIRTALMLYGDVKKSFIDKDVAEAIKNSWDSSFVPALNKLVDVFNDLHMNVNDYKGRWNVLLPVIFMIYYNPNYLNYKNNIKNYIYRAVFFKFFQNGTTGKLTKLKKAIETNDYIITNNILESSYGELSVNAQKIEDILQSEYKSYVGTAVLNALSSDWTDVNVRYAQDHIHPKAEFDKNPPIGISPEEWASYKKKYNTLPNLQLLSEHENSEVKGDRSLEGWLNGKTQEEQQLFMKRGLLPGNVSHELKDFGKFYEARKELLRAKIEKFLVE